MHLTRTEPDTNLHRFYRMEIVRGLFEDWGLVRNCGADRKWRTVKDWFDTETEDARFELHMKKAKRGYE